jgi:hypothetical protein
MSPDPSSDELHSDTAEARMRRSLGLATASDHDVVPSSPNDPLKGARQAIRSQVAAREYVERQLSQAQVAVQELRGKLRNARQEKDGAVEAARAAVAAKVTAERTLVGTEAALAAEKNARERLERSLRDALATARDLQVRLDAAAQTLQTVQGELAAERQDRQKAEDALLEATLTHEATEQAAVIEPERGPDTAIQRRGQPDGFVDSDPVAAPADRDAVAEPVVRRPVRRPRKNAAEPPVLTPVRSSRQAATKSKAVPKQAGQPKGRRRVTEDQQPVEWWVEGWGRRAK